MNYKLNHSAEINQTSPSQASLDIRTDDTITGVFLSVSVSFNDFGAGFTPADFSLELSWLSDTAQSLTNDTQGQLCTLHFSASERSTDNDAQTFEGWCQHVYVPFPEGVKVQSGERIYLNVIPHRSMEGVVVRACANIQTKSSFETRAIRRR